VGETDSKSCSGLYGVVQPAPKAKPARQTIAAIRAANGASGHTYAFFNKTHYETLLRVLQSGIEVDGYTNNAIACRYLVPTIVQGVARCPTTIHKLFQ
jgi:hypothetical protein